ncbi:MAG: ferredoxin-NADP reductase, partial [Gammaproteobacteria bacterium]
ASRHSVLDTAMQDWIQSADTFFIASGYHGDDDNPRTIGMDASHRGGQPGFVKVENSRRIIFPDYAGNNHFNTIGNLILEPGVGLLFVDFAKGDLLQITGRASIDWDSAEVANFPGAQRLVTIDIDEIVFLQCVLPLRWRKPVESNQTLKVANKIQESHDVISFELVSEDGKKLPEFKAGQYLPIEFETHDSRIQRTYSISNGTGSDHYRISVKREPRGLASRYLHDVVEPGDTIKAGTPMGDFVIGDTHRPVVLVSAGIGITPMISMLNQLGSLANNKPIYFFHGTRNSTSHAFSKYVNALAKTLPNLKIEFSYSRPNLNDKPEIDYQHTGHVSGERIRQLVQEHDACYYLCGPPGFISEVSNSLVSDGVDQASIYLETFGSAN